MPKANLPTTIVTGTVEGFNKPKEWKSGQYGNYKVCGIKLKDCAKAEWLNYFWNEMAKDGTMNDDPFARLEKGKTYSFICTEKEYQGKKQYTPINYELVSSPSVADDNATARTAPDVDEHDYPESAPVTKEIKAPEFRVVGYLIQDQDGNVYEAKA